MKEILIFLGLCTSISFQLSVDDPNLTKEALRAQATSFDLNPWIHGLEYGRYMDQVYQIIINHEGLKSKLHKDIKEDKLLMGELAEQIHLLPEQERTKLDELKRLELDRIRKLVEELHKNGHVDKWDVKETTNEMLAHVDMKNLSKFNAADLQNLIQTATRDLQYMDKLRRLRFKEYEMHKRLELEELMKRQSPEKQIKLRRNRDALLIKHKSRKPLHMPISKAHLLHVWEERDKMNREDFNIKTFFELHDLDENNFLDEVELKVLIAYELKEHFNPEGEYDEREKNEEMERMREYAFKHVDTNNDHMLSYEEFKNYVEGTGKNDSHYWEILNPIYHFTNDEYLGYAQEHRKQVNEMIDAGLITLPDTGIVEHKV